MTWLKRWGGWLVAGVVSAASLAWYVLRGRKIGLPDRAEVEDADARAREARSDARSLREVVDDTRAREEAARDALLRSGDAASVADAIADSMAEPDATQQPRG